MKFVFLGCPGADCETDNLGYRWTKGEPIDVTDDAKIERLLLHPHFARVDVSHETETPENIEQVEPLNAFDLPSDPLPVDDVVVPIKRKGRPPGSKNKPKDEVA